MKEHRMKIVYVYRKKSPHGFSLEKVFRAVSKQIHDADVLEYVMRSRVFIFADILNIRKLKADIFHVTGDVNYIAPFLPHDKTVLTIQDIGHYLFGLKGIKQFIYKWLWISLPMHFARIVHYTSEETRRNIIENFDIPRSKLKYIPNCLTADVVPTQHEFLSACPNILQVGTKPYKNVPRLIYALKDISCKLVIVGLLDEAIRSALDETNIAYENHVGVSDEDLVALYQHCDLVSFVSIGEGFGLPILEAQAAGKPLITSDIEPLCSVAGQGACLADPLDVCDIRRGLQKLIDDSRYRDHVVVVGLQNVKAYSPRAIADEFIALYKGLSG